MAMTNPTTRPEALDECLTAILFAPNFSVADYLNTALADEDAHDSTENNSRDMQRSMAELAMQLQLQTQSCHEDIARIGAELQAVLPRCAAVYLTVLEANAEGDTAFPPFEAEFPRSSVVQSLPGVAEWRLYER